MATLWVIDVKFTEMTTIGGGRVGGTWFCDNKHQWSWQDYFHWCSESSTVDNLPSSWWISIDTMNHNVKPGEHFTAALIEYRKRTFFIDAHVRRHMRFPWHMTDHFAWVLNSNIEGDMYTTQNSVERCYYFTRLLVQQLDSDASTMAHLILLVYVYSVYMNPGDHPQEHKLAQTCISECLYCERQGPLRYYIYTLCP